MAFLESTPVPTASHASLQIPGVKSLGVTSASRSNLMIRGINRQLSSAGVPLSSCEGRE